MHSGAMTTYRVLLVEDQEIDAMLIQRLLQRPSNLNAFEIDHVASLGAACDALTQNDYDVALLDLHLPDGQGMDSFHRLRAVDARLPIVILTGHEDESMGQQAVETGAQDFVAKGAVSGPAIHRILRYSIARHRKMMGFAAEAHTDALTRLPNRRKLHERHRDLAELCDSIAAFIVDIDHFKSINDRLGHFFGDRTLCLFADVFREWADRFTGPTLARLGGDEFVALLPALTEPAAISAANQLLTMIRSTPVETESTRHSLTASVGVSIAESHQPLGDVLAQADLALYRAKQHGRDQCWFAE
ncbi:MAG: GGDEF domain-containing response regulator [Planctomycetota bacterium]